jgi:hypothetical protein
MQDGSQKRQRIRELKVFTSFVTTLRMAVIPGSVKLMEPPQPDILCEVSGQGIVAFELVEIIDRSFANGIAKEIKTRAELNESFRRLEGQQRPTLQGLYSDAIIFVQFKNEVSFQKRKGIMPTVFRFLATLPSGFKGDVDRKTLPLRGSLDYIFVSRIRGLAGPMFDCNSGGSIGDPTISAISEKCRTVYRSKYPKHLLAYVDSHPMVPDDIWLPTLHDFLQTMPKDCQFERLWVYDYGKAALLYQFP